MQTALILGANRGIGLGLAAEFLRRDWAVHATARDLDAAPDLRELRESHPNRLNLHRADVIDEASIVALAGALEGISLNLLIHNAGVYGPRMSGIEEVDSAEWMRVLRINTVAPYQCARLLLPRVARGGAIGFLSSRMGSLEDNSSGGSYVYRASKAGLNATVKSLSIDLTEAGIAVAALHPGWVQTDMGGESAPLDVTSSVRGLAEVMTTLTPARSGSFLAWDGEVIPW